MSQRTLMELLKLAGGLALLNFLQYKYIFNKIFKSSYTGWTTQLQTSQPGSKWKHYQQRSHCVHGCAPSYLCLSLPSWSALQLPTPLEYGSNSESIMACADPPHWPRLLTTTILSHLIRTPHFKFGSTEALSHLTIYTTGTYSCPIVT